MRPGARLPRATACTRNSAIGSAHSHRATPNPTNGWLGPTRAAGDQKGAGGLLPTKTLIGSNLGHPFQSHGYELIVIGIKRKSPVGTLKLSTSPLISPSRQQPSSCVAAGRPPRSAVACAASSHASACAYMSIGPARMPRAPRTARWCAVRPVPRQAAGLRVGTLAACAS
jgi:hypothetical protein